MFSYMQDDCLEITLLIKFVSDDYPQVVPLLGVSCQSLPPPILQGLTKELTQQAQGLVGSPMIHELASSITEHLNAVLCGETENSDVDEEPRQQREQNTEESTTGSAVWDSMM